MNDIAFTLVHGLISFILLLVGVLALLLPQGKYSSMVGYLWLVGKSGGPSGSGREIQRRAVGLLLALVGLFGLKGDLASSYNPRPEGRPPIPANPPFGGINPAWLPFVLGLLAVSAGCFVALNPEPLVRWSQRSLFPERRMPESALRTWRFALRLAGALMVYSSTELFAIWARR